MCVPGIKLRSSGSKCLYLLSHLSGPYDWDLVKVTFLHQAQSQVKLATFLFCFKGMGDSQEFQDCPYALKSLSWFALKYHWIYRYFCAFTAPFMQVSVQPKERKNFSAIVYSSLSLRNILEVSGHSRGPWSIFLRTLNQRIFFLYIWQSSHLYFEEKFENNMFLSIWHTTWLSLAHQKLRTWYCLAVPLECYQLNKIFRIVILEL